MKDNIYELLHDFPFCGIHRHFSSGKFFAKIVVALISRLHRCCIKSLTRPDSVGIYGQTK